MVTCETLPLAPDLVVDDERTLTEPVEVGPFRTGIVFVHVSGADAHADDGGNGTAGGGGRDPTVAVEVGVSPTGYDDWETHWVRRERVEVGTGMSALPLDWFGNWIRLSVRTLEGGEATVRAWFVGKE
jgi:hypothetical protein